MLVFRYKADCADDAGSATVGKLEIIDTVWNFIIHIYRVIQEEMPVFSMVMASIIARKFSYKHESNSELSPRQSCWNVLI